MPNTRIALTWLLSLMFTLSVFARADSKINSPLPLGSAGFIPTVDRPVGWRGDGTGCYTGATSPLQWQIGKDGRGTGLLWRTQLPLFDDGSGASQPIVVGNRIFFEVGPKDATRGPQDLYCLSLDDGKILWIRSLTEYDGADDADRRQIETTVRPLLQGLENLNQRLADALNAGTLDQNNWRSNVDAQRISVGTKINDAFIALNKDLYGMRDRHDWGYASATPASDGQYVYVRYSNRLGGCYDLDGKLIWAVFEPKKLRDTSEHGSHASPTLLSDRVIFVYGNLVQAFDKKTGKLLWQQEAENAWGLCSSSLVSARVADQPILMLAQGQALRGDTGQSLWSKFGGYQGENTTPVLAGNTLLTYERSGIRTFTLPQSLDGGVLTPGPSLHYKNSFAEYQIASPLMYDGLAYCINDKGLLHVFDTAKGEIVYDQQLDLKAADKPWVGNPGLSASPSIGGKNLYVTDNYGTTVVLQSGREYKVLSKNEIATGERFITSPVFAGKCALIRAQSSIFCLGEK